MRSVDSDQSVGEPRMVYSVPSERRFTESFPDRVEWEERSGLLRVHFPGRRLFLESVDAVLYIRGLGPWSLLLRIA